MAIKWVPLEVTDDFLVNLRGHLAAADVPLKSEVDQLAMAVVLIAGGERLGPLQSIREQKRVILRKKKVLSRRSSEP
jgi:hypothetical protein